MFFYINLKMFLFQADVSSSSVAKTPCLGQKVFAKIDL